jgi:hypothetical protein
MLLADRIAQCHTPFRVQSHATGTVVRLHGAAECAHEIRACPSRFVLTDELTRLCTALAYSRGARTLDCADLLHVPAERVWVEWCQAPWERELAQYRFAVPATAAAGGARRGALIHASRDGRRGLLRTFWSNGDADVMAASMEAYFDLDTAAGDDPEPPHGVAAEGIQVFDGGTSGQDVMARCFRFRYEPSWAAYYAQAQLAGRATELLRRHVLGTIAIDIPVLLLFFLLLATRSGLPRREQRLERLNRARLRRGRPPLLEHIEVSCPLLSARSSDAPAGTAPARRAPRLHHVRGHLFRRGSELFWRVPHLRGCARSGQVRTRTVSWTFAGSVASSSDDGPRGVNA